MIFKKGDVVLVNYPHSDGISDKLRPALIVQKNTTDINQITVAMITSRNRTGPTRVKIAKNSAANVTMNLLTDSVIVCDNLTTVTYDLINRVIGHTPPEAIVQVDGALIHHLGL